MLSRKITDGTEFVVFDMEWNQPIPGKEYPFDVSRLTGEIIEIGALKYIYDNGELIYKDSFSADITPVNYTKLHYHVKKVTHKKNADLLNGIPFKAAYDSELPPHNWYEESIIQKSQNQHDCNGNRHHTILPDLVAIPHGNGRPSGIMHRYGRVVCFHTVGNGAQHLHKLCIAFGFTVSVGRGLHNEAPFPIFGKDISVVQFKV